ncbi:MAG TPA: hypothetical protein VLL97_09580 [Acidobacteriota bacterium]|nr:hypothetical protein [Acidobacteriota bacterium]
MDDADFIEFDSMITQHRELAAGRWRQLSFVEQMANVGSEIERVISWKTRGRPDIGSRAFDRELELLDLTIADVANRRRLKELVRVREALADFFVFDNEYNSTQESWQRYFRFFLNAARGNR